LVGVNATGCGLFGYTGCGTAFELSHSAGGWTKTLLYTFCSESNCADGALPNGDLAIDATKTLYGTALGGSSFGGTAFALSPDSKGDWHYTVIYEFQGGTDAIDPDGGLIFDKSGNLYGTAGGPGVFFPDYFIGSIFVLHPGSQGWSDRVLYTFCSQNCRDGFSPAAALAWGPDGDLYGATNNGGARSWGCRSRGCGVLFSLTSSKEPKYKVLRTLAGADGSNPMSALISDDLGNLYGTTVWDGAFGTGTVFRLSRTANGRWKYSVLHEFSLGRCCANFRSALVLDARGNLYGTTWTGGSGRCYGQGCGLIYKLTPGNHDTWKYTDLYNFTGESDGGWPTGRLAIDKNGNLYGAAAWGGKARTG